MSNTSKHEFLNTFLKHPRTDKLPATSTLAPPGHKGFPTCWSLQPGLSLFCWSTPSNLSLFSCAGMFSTGHIAQICLIRLSSRTISLDLLAMLCLMWPRRLLPFFKVKMTILVMFKKHWWVWTTLAQRKAARKLSINKYERFFRLFVFIVVCAPTRRLKRNFLQENVVTGLGGMALYWKRLV